jgi:hypothetical protein
MLASFSMSAKAVARCSSRSRATAACFAPTAMCRAHRYKKRGSRDTRPDVAPARRTKCQSHKPHSVKSRDTARGEALGGDLGQVAGTSLDKGVELDALAKLPKDERKGLIDRAKAGQRVSARKEAKLAADPLCDVMAAERQVARLMDACRHYFCSGVLVKCVSLIRLPFSSSTQTSYPSARSAATSEETCSGVSHKTVETVPSSALAFTHQVTAYFPFASR